MYPFHLRLEIHFNYYTENYTKHSFPKEQLWLDGAKYACVIALIFQITMITPMDSFMLIEQPSCFRTCYFINQC